MNFYSDAMECISLECGAQLPAPRPGHVWRLNSGALRVRGERGDLPSTMVWLALPGDLIGIDLIAGTTARPQYCEIISPSTLIEFEVNEANFLEVLQQGFICMRKRCAEMVALRSGSVPHRVRSLLLLLADHQCTKGGIHRNFLPSLRDMAIIIDSRVETVSRVLGGMKESRLLHDRKEQRGTLNIKALRGFKFPHGMTSSSPIRKQKLNAVVP